MAQHYLLRVEATNLAHVVEDTTQLSVARGGSRMALEAPRAIDEVFNSVAGWRWRMARWFGLAGVPELISHGASAGLYKFSAPRWVWPNLETGVAARLRKKWPQLTVAVDVQELSPDLDQSNGAFPTAHETVIARNRFRQMREPSLAFPSGKGSSPGPCGIDGVRPADPGSSFRDEPCSTSVRKRHKYGSREEKKKFFREQSGVDGVDYADDFNEIAGRFRDRRLENKLAVIYLDGNHFGKRQMNCASAGDLRDFDRYIRTRRREFLGKLIQDAQGDDDWFFREPGPEADAKRWLRLELLLWGGDEILMVVPAWKGLETLHALYAASAAWQWKDKKLTHAGALIFCQVKTPIDRMIALAREVVGEVKRSPGGRDRDLFDYLILESVDFPAEPVHHYWRGRYADAHKQRGPLPLPGSAADGPKLRRDIAKLRDQDMLPRGKFHHGVKAIIRATGPVAIGDAVDQLVENLETSEVVGKSATNKMMFDELRANLAKLFPDQSACWQWLHLFELWDYFGARNNEGKTS